MRNFACTKCNGAIYFDNNACLQCNHAVGFYAPKLTMVALEPSQSAGGLMRIVKGGDKSLFNFCANAAHGVCNWLTPANALNKLCIACDLNRTIPNLSEPGNLVAWQELEIAKKRLVYSILRFGLPLRAATTPPGQLTFDFARNTTTGHLDGVISVNIMETDAVERERTRLHFGEPYRTLLGHLRHESGHFYWSMLVEHSEHIDAFRALFGDERLSYPEAISRHHAVGPPADWKKKFVSAYAAAHAWEDWAESWAHYLHMTEAVDTAEWAGMEPRAAGLIFGSMWPFRRCDIYREETFQSLIDRWIPLTIAMNRLTRSMGHSDFYPFVISAAARQKLAFVHKVVRQGPLRR